MRRATGAVLTLAVAACGGEDRTPEGAATLFMRAIDEGAGSEVYRLLAPSTQEALAKLQQLAAAQAGVSRRFKPEDLLAVGQEGGERKWTIGATSINGDRATVRLLSAKKKTEDRITLIRVGGVWRVLVPPGLVAPPAAAPTSATRPASAPASRP